MPAVPKASEPSRRSASAAASPLPSSRSSSARVSGSGSASRQAAPLAARLLSGPVIAHSLATLLGSRPRPHPPPPAACCRRHPARSHPPEAKDQPFLVSEQEWVLGPCPGTARITDGSGCAGSPRSLLRSRPAARIVCALRDGRAGSLASPGTGSGLGGPMPAAITLVVAGIG